MQAQLSIQATYDERNRAHLMGIGPHWDTEGPGKTEVGQLQIVALIDQEILWLEIPMEDAMRVTVKQSRCELVSESLQQMKKKKTRVRSWVERI